MVVTVAPVTFCEATREGLETHLRHMDAPLGPALSLPVPPLPPLENKDAFVHYTFTEHPFGRSMNEKEPPSNLLTIW